MRTETTKKAIGLALIAAGAILFMNGGLWLLIGTLPVMAGIDMLDNSKRETREERQ